VRVLIDSDVLIDVGLNRAPFADFAAQVLDGLEARHGTGFVAWHSIANLFYLVSPASGKENALGYIRDLSGFISVAPVETKDLLYALSLDMADFEDAMQAAAAVACKADWIVTRNIRHYRKSPVKAISPEELLTLPGWV
jgi:predicted nucleic acid-binding protein